SGISILEYLHQNFPEVKVLMVTGCPSAETREKARQLGVQNWLAKPVELDELESRVNKLIDRTFNS
ncbi:MAG: response regulator, partial [Desulforhabdus sp.]|nr:response regulator [Desulforhabdus sp.]